MEFPNYSVFVMISAVIIIIMASLASKATQDSLVKIFYEE